MQRREFMTLLGGASVAWPIAARAQQSAMPVVGFLSGISANERPHLVESFRRGLSEVGYVAGQNVAVEYRYAENQPDRLRALAADLIARRVAVIAATGGNNSALVAKSLTTTIPIVFTSGVDPVRAGLVSSFRSIGLTSMPVTCFMPKSFAANMSLPPPTPMTAAVWRCGRKYAMLVTS